MDLEDLFFRLDNDGIYEVCHLIVQNGPPAEMNKADWYLLQEDAQRTLDFIVSIDKLRDEFGIGYS